MNEVIRAPLVPSDSLDTWTRISWPRPSTYSMGWSDAAARSSGSPPPRSPSGAPPGPRPAQRGELVPARHGEPRLGHAGVDDDPFPHGSPRSGNLHPGGNPAVTGTAAFVPRAGAQAP